MGITVLGMHQHYSIDVFAAFFITYGCYKFGNWFLMKSEHFANNKIPGLTNKDNSQYS